jgi:antitoxin component YwqK of YwqJK toxin-antitoxin module
MYEMQYKEGKKSGTWKMYNADGSLKNERAY